MRHNKRIAPAAGIVAALVLLTGCGESVLPELTEDEVRAVGEYVAVTMMKYDMNHRSRLMDLSALEAAVTPSADPGQQPEPEEPTGMEPVDDTPVVNGEGPVSSTLTPEEVLDFPEGLTLDFTDWEIGANYTDEGGLVSVNASDGRKLLVLKFSLVNVSAQEQEADLLSSDASFTVIVNGDYSRNALMTMLPDDLSTFSGTLSAGDGRETVLIIEVEDDMIENITSISLRVKNESKSSAIQLLQ